MRPLGQRESLGPTILTPPVRPICSMQWTELRRAGLRRRCRRPPRRRRRRPESLSTRLPATRAIRQRAVIVLRRAPAPLPPHSPLTARVDGAASAFAAPLNAAEWEAERCRSRYGRKWTDRRGRHRSVTGDW